MPSIKFQRHLFICSGKSCSQRGDAEKAKAFFKAKIKESGNKENLRACTSSCLGYCEVGPNMVLYPQGKIFNDVSEEDWESIWKKLYEDPSE